MDYVGNVIRPPSEAYSMLIQAAVGCSHNMCTFCGAYKGEKHRLKDIKTIKRDIDEASTFGAFKKAFIADGDFLIQPNEVIIDIMSYIKKKSPTVKRIGVYGTMKAINRKSIAELKELKEAGLGIIYQGVETGNAEILKKIKKGAKPEMLIETSKKPRAAGILLSQTFLLGIGGIEMSEEHAIDTGKLISLMKPDFASALTVMLLPNTELYHDQKNGKFQLPDKFGILKELQLIVENIDVSHRMRFASNHASNYLPILADFPADKEKTVALIRNVLDKKDESMLKPEFMRAL